MQTFQPSTHHVSKRIVLLAGFVAIFAIIWVADTPAQANQETNPDAAVTQGHHGQVRAEMEGQIEKADKLLDELRHVPSERLKSATANRKNAESVIIELQVARDEIERQLQRYDYTKFGGWKPDDVERELRAAAPVLQRAYDDAAELKNQVSG